MKNFLKYISIIIVVISGIVACETDFDNVGADLLDSNIFGTDKATYEVLAYTKNVEKSRVDNMSVNGLGIYKTGNFGILRANVATQISVPLATEFGLNPIIDAIILDLPYDATSDGKDSDGKPKFILNNIYGDQETEFTLKVSRLNTFLNALDPEDPTKPKKYYSNRTYNKFAEALFAGNFKPNKNDTVLYVLRPEFEPTIETLDFNYDTIIKTDSKPSIKLPLNHDFFAENFDTGIFENQDLFTQTFNGLLFESEGDDGSLMLLNFAAATINIYYTNEVLTPESVTDSDGVVTETDLNNNGIIDPDPVPVKTKQTMTFGFNGIRTNAFDRDYTSSFVEPALNDVNENKKLYIQGAQGSIVSLDAFNNIDLADIRSKDWLINEANLVFNVDQDASGDVVPPRLFLYKLDEVDDDSNKDAQILDILTEGEAVYDGNLQKEDDDNDDTTTEQPIKYRFRITDYLSEVLKNEDATQPVKFGIKAFHITDFPNLQNPADTIVREFSWDPRGVVLYGNDYLPADPDYDKRLKLEIYYTKLNN